MSNETEFPEGIVFQPPREGAPDFVKGRAWIKRKEMIAWLESKDEDSINLDIKEARTGKWYAAVNAYQPKGDKPQRASGGANQARGGNPDDDIPFRRVGGLA